MTSAPPRVRAADHTAALFTRPPLMSCLTLPLTVVLFTFGRALARPTVRLAVAIVAVVLTHVASAFYLPGVAPHEYSDGETVCLLVFLFAVMPIHGTPWLVRHTCAVSGVVPCLTLLLAVCCPCAVAAGPESQQAHVAELCSVVRVLRPCFLSGTLAASRAVMDEGPGHALSCVGRGFPGQIPPLQSSAHSKRFGLSPLSSTVRANSRPRFDLPLKIWAST